jgi:SAM-dependent methyltransferase
MFAEDDIERRRVEREAADRAYNEALTALDRAFPTLPELPHPPVAYDESQLPALNDRWRIMVGDPAAGLTGWRGRAARMVWRLVGPILERQQSFNATLVDHLNRNVASHRANREAVEAVIGTMRGELEKLEAFHTRLVLYLQHITRFVDTKDRSEHIATLTNMLETGVSWVAAEFRRHLEAMAARERRYVAAVDELRTSIASVQQAGLMLKRELERGAAAPAPPAASAGARAAAVADVPAAALSPRTGATAADAVNAYKYVAFENKFRGSTEDIRTRLLQYVQLFDGADGVLDLGCGRGEFLALLRDRGIRSHGLDLNHEMVEACHAAGLEAREGDALAYLESLPDASLGGLIAVQVVEHFEPAYLVRLLDAAYYKLKPGSTIVLETLNPSCWFAFFEAYIRDITHAWPLHPETLKFLVVASGFQRVDLRWLSPYPPDAKLQYIELPPDARTTAMTALARTFNENVDKANAVMFSYLDYAIVGQRL